MSPVRACILLIDERRSSGLECTIGSTLTGRLTRMLTEAGNFLFRYRNSLFPVACVLLFLPGPDPFPDAMQAAAAGAVVALLGQIIRGATIGLRYVVRGGRN